MTHYFIGIGSNENTEHNCVAMIRTLRACFSKVTISSVVMTPAHGVNAPDYVTRLLVLSRIWIWLN